MSNQAINWAISQPIRGPKKAVLVALANRANKDSRQCWPSHKLIASEAGVAVSTAKKALNGLRERGLIDWTQRPDGKGGLSSNLYTLLYPQPGDDRPPGREGAKSSPDSDRVLVVADLPPPPGNGEKPSGRTQTESKENRERTFQLGFRKGKEIGI